MNKIILTDCDEVLFDFSTPFEEWIRNYKGLNPKGPLGSVYKPEIWLDLPRNEAQDLHREMTVTKRKQSFISWLLSYGVGVAFFVAMCLILSSILFGLLGIFFFINLWNRL